MPIIIPVGTGASVSSGVTTYSGLVASAGLWLERADLATRIPDFMALFEARLNRILRCPEMEEVVVLPTTAGVATLPSDFLQARHLYINDTYDREIVPKALSTFRTGYPTTGTPTSYSIVDGEIHLFPAPTATTSITLHYYEKIPALSASNESNWVSASHPDIYLYGILVQAEFYGWNDARLPLIKSALDEAIDELQAQGRSKRHGGGPLYPRAVSAP